ncbi:tyrosine-type recombinase/integrase [Campylobacter canadensis]|uniref:tyrosine-type recombinase/integrase n=1 Tax=Campylobacter canadensis TaxID=449520 RepID=UPI00155513B7|nr:site-specific integrase [Campylobacter canadensis]MBZ7994947.1 tyrosine-type recombinase/integrase [Campylobacter canadensis]MBZ7996903.1 tyrosine-type recombinase/integrase [Campylobacter canadensis]MBZ8000382.1 tyrosine-type recombinase/integrase [Campylobacter canadensis]MBZ8002183.1 tyrosine-type recombinase/integrase [Campylobacter canadensis]MBZ8003106.1 tyrosine-type recombinase/integrase [Campylobacter canadensis]
MTNKQIQALKPKSKRYKVSVYNNIYIYVGTNGNKTFYYRYNDNGKDKIKKLNNFNISYGIEQAINDYTKLAENISRGFTKTINKSLNDLFDEFLASKEKAVTDKTYKRYISTFRIFESLKNNNLSDLKALQIVECLKSCDKKEASYRAFTLINQLYEFAICNGDEVINPLAKVKPSVLLGKKDTKNYATLTNDDDLTRLFTIIRTANTNILYKYALILQSLTALRTQNIRAMRWEWINFNDGFLSIPSEQMKTKKPFYLPLNSQALKILNFMKATLKADEIFIFPSRTNKKEPYISDNTLRIILRRGGITKDEFTPHGFRAMFSTIANDNNYSSEIIELCLAHTVGGVKGIYDRSHKLEAKRELMQWWGDYLEKYIKDFL